MDEEQNPPRRLTLKPKEIVPTDERPRPGDGTALSVELMHRMNQAAEARAAARLWRSMSWTRMASGSGIARGASSGRTLAAKANPKDELIAMPARRRSRRNRDFLLLLSCAGVAALVLGIVFRNNLPVIGLALAAIAMLVLVLAWVLFGVMDRY